ncbi:GAF domain-containing protein [Cellulosimicrobium sp. CUA-896]|uniref:GAF domain-containing protein n=1 Tax=Cellulosimicrobium sp. CUA-896 TaxID=1517881 RepID=UPI00095EA4B8|nr:GAF domain-containing protein [Cellulosimicrobium sp. CUA-896]OLT53231.1 phytochrome sensor protein [Cellulosimicrobium sp. CUA-896]
MAERPATPGGPARRDPRSVRAAYDVFLGTGALLPGVDPLVAASWRRSLRSGVDPDTPRPGEGLAGDELEAYRAAHPLASLMPVVRELVVDGARDDGLVVAVSDDAGRLLWVEGSARTRGAVERVGFAEGAVWREERVGTNAPGTALATRRPVQVLGAEHFSRPVQDLNCAAAPIRGPGGEVVGVLDVTGGLPAASHVVLSLVRATVATLERELAARAVAADGRHGAPALRLLGTPAVVLPDGARRLSLRHAEILALLAEHPRGLSADELAVLLHPGDLSAVTVRAEVSRLRRVAGTLLVGSRPYRLARPVATDVGVVRERLARGDVAGAVAAYGGPLLVRSSAPGIERLRAELAAELRAAVHASDDAACSTRGPAPTTVPRTTPRGPASCTSPTTAAPCGARPCPPRGARHRPALSGPATPAEHEFDVATRP